MKLLHILESAYRATLEEQDDTVIWFSHAMKNAGADVRLLLRSHAVNYAVSTKNTPPIPSLGVEHPPNFGEDLQKVIAKGSPVYVWGKDLEERGIDRQSLIQGVQIVDDSELGRLINETDRILHW